MKKLCIILCITVIMMSGFSVCAMEEYHETVKTTGFSAPATVYLLPAEQEISKITVSATEFVKPLDISVEMVEKSLVSADKYIPDIMEQINIISVAPRK